MGSVGRGRRLLLRSCSSCRTARQIPMKVRSMVGLIPLFAVEHAGAGGARQAARISSAAWSGSSTIARTLTADIACMDNRGRRPSGDCCRIADRGPTRGASCGSCSTRPSFSRRTASARCRAVSPRAPVQGCGGRQRSTASTTNRPSPTPACSAATPTGAARSGSR